MGQLSSPYEGYTHFLWHYVADKIMNEPQSGTITFGLISYRSDVHIFGRVFAIYQIMLGWKTCNHYYETDEFPNPRPTQPNKKMVKSGIRATFSPQQAIFRGLGFTLCRKQSTRNPTQRNEHPIRLRVERFGTRGQNKIASGWSGRLSEWCLSSISKAHSSTRERANQMHATRRTVAVQV